VTASDQSLAQLAPLGCSNLVRLGPIANLTRFRVLRLVVQTRSVGSGRAWAEARQPAADAPEPTRM